MELHISFIILFIFYVNGIVYGNINKKNVLKKQLFGNYDNEILPTGPNGTAVIVTVEMFGAVVIQVKETQQITSYLLAHAQKWIDPRFTWDPAENGIESILVPISKIWHPDLYIYNSIEFKNLVDEDKDFARIYSTGLIEINTPQYLDAFCTIKVHMFPFDTQFCTIAITSNQLSITELNISVVQPKFANFKFMGNSEWEILNVSQVFHELFEAGIWGIPTIEYQYIFQIKRRSTFYVTVIIIPIFLISSLSVIGIFAPGSKNETGNCVNLGLATLLALIFLLGIVSERLPKSDDMPLLGYYILVILITFTFCSILESMLLYYSSSRMKSGSIPPKWLYKITRTPMKYEEKEALKGIDLQQALNINGTVVHKSNGILPVPALNKKRDDLNHTLREFFVEQRKFLNKSGKDEGLQELEDEWDKIENKLDLFWIFFFEALNIINLVFLMLFVSAPIMSIDDWLYGKNPVELFSS